MTMEVVIAVIASVACISFISIWKKTEPVWPPLVRFSAKDIKNPDSSEKIIKSEEDKDKAIFRNNKIKPEGTTEETDANKLKHNTHECDSLIEKSVEIKFSNEEIKSSKDETRQDECDSGEIVRGRRVLFVIAHPDDECMFFGPTVLHFTSQQNAMVFLVCLTEGAYRTSDAYGARRQKELWKSCDLLGIPAANITLYKCSHIPDNPNRRWPAMAVANIIKKHAHTLDCDMVITFDQGGVSGHQNHRALHKSLQILVDDNSLPPHATAYSLDTVNLMRKYLVFLDVPASILLDKTVVIAPSRHRSIIKQAMKAHASQYVWFRKLYMAFSRYTLVNSLTELHARECEQQL